MLIHINMIKRLSIPGQPLKVCHKLAANIGVFLKPDASKLKAYTMSELCEWENLGEPEEGKYKTDRTDYDTNLKHILGLDKTCRECDSIRRCRNRHQHRK